MKFIVELKLNTEEMNIIKTAAAWSYRSTHDPDHVSIVSARQKRVAETLKEILQSSLTKLKGQVKDQLGDGKNKCVS